MAFKTLADLDADVCYAIGGVDKKSKKPNPTSVEGYFIGTRQVPSPKSKSGFAALHILQTQKGNVGIWGKTNLDQKLGAVTPGDMIRISFTGMKETKNNPMYTYKVEVDKDNTIDVSGVNAGPAENGEDDSAGAYEEEEIDLDGDDVPLDEVPPARPKAPPRAASAPSAERQAKVNSLLNGRRSSAA